MIAVVCGWHEHHIPATEEIERRLSQGETLTVAAPALVEAYAVSRVFLHRIVSLRQTPSLS
jgi:hypothetical protein